MVGAALVAPALLGLEVGVNHDGIGQIPFQRARDSGTMLGRDMETNSKERTRSDAPRDRLQCWGASRYNTNVKGTLFAFKMRGQDNDREVGTQSAPPGRRRCREISAPNEQCLCSLLFM